MGWLGGLAEHIYHLNIYFTDFLSTSNCRNEMFSEKLIKNLILGKDFSKLKYYKRIRTQETKVVFAFFFTKVQKFRKTSTSNEMFPKKY